MAGKQPSNGPGHGRPQGLLISWWGALKGSGCTVGDLWAIRAVVGRLEAFGVPLVIASRYPVDHHPITDWRLVAEESVDAHVFVCGPLIWENRELQALFETFASRPNYAVGVSVLQEKVPWLAGLFLRDAPDGPANGFDLALACPDARLLYSGQAPSSDGLIGVCLRGHQTEYGSITHHAEVVQAVEEAFPEALWLDTRLDADPGGACFFDQLRSCRAIVTTRLHGALFAAAAGIPFVAIDQIPGGAKVTSVLKRLAPETLLPVHKIGTLADAVQSTVRTPRPVLRERAQRSIYLAEAALDAAVSLLLSDPSYRTRRGMP